MEENVYTQEPVQSEDLKLGLMAKSYLAGAAKWAKFLAIVSFICCGLMVVMALSAGAWMSALGSSMGAYGAMYAAGSTAVFTITYLAAAIVSFILALFLFRFATKAQQALAQNDNGLVVESLGNLKNYFQINGIILIIALAFIALGIVIGIIAGVAGVMA